MHYRTHLFEWQLPPPMIFPELLFLLSMNMKRVRLGKPGSRWPVLPKKSPRPCLTKMGSDQVQSKESSQWPLRMSRAVVKKGSSWMSESKQQSQGKQILAVCLFYLQTPVEIMKSLSMNISSSVSCAKVYLSRGYSRNKGLQKVPTPPWQTIQEQMWWMRLFLCRKLFCADRRDRWPTLYGSGDPEFIYLWIRANGQRLPSCSHLAHRSSQLSPLKPQMSAPTIWCPNMFRSMLPLTASRMNSQVAILSPVQWAWKREDPRDADLESTKGRDQASESSLLRGRSARQVSLAMKEPQTE